jgi:plasmid stabilization system protein ParE
MAFRVEISPRAFEDLDRISAYIRHRGSFESAERWFNGIVATTRCLSTGGRPSLLPGLPTARN